ncbi:hypothetical protein FUMI01_28210 [Flavobacterium sp. UMI-01]|nr:hypothetical protein FUMI01_28210 [Flavobacterium sp. UMI-01]
MTWSCSSNLDFDQANDLNLTPVFVANLTYFDVPAHEFVTNGVENTVGVAGLGFDAFRDSFFRENLVRTDLFFELTNTINRAYVIDLFMLNESDQVVYTVHFDVPAASSAPQVVAKTEVFQGITLEQFKQTEKMVFRLVMLPGAPLTENSLGSLKMKSSATVYMDIQ